MNDDPKDTAAALKLIADTVKPSALDDMTSRLREDLESGLVDSQHELIAKLCMVRYRAYIKAGFSDTQALYLLGR